jgi:hypothetical protein
VWGYFSLLGLNINNLPQTLGQKCLENESKSSTFHQTTNKYFFDNTSFIFFCIFIFYNTSKKIFDFLGFFVVGCCELGLVPYLHLGIMG